MFPVASITVSVVGMVTVFLVSYYIARNIIVEESLQKIAQAVTSESVGMDGWLNAQKATIDVLGADLVALDDLNKVKPLLEAQAKLNSNIIDIYIGLSDNSGVFAYWEASPGWEATQRGWYAAGMASPNTPATIVYSDFDTNELRIAFTKNIGKIQNLDTVLTCDLDLQAFAERISSIDTSDGGYVFLVDDT